MKIKVLNLDINTENKLEILSEVLKRLKNNQKTFIVTPYSEFFYYAARDFDFQQILNKADFALPDGIGVQWAAYYLSTPLKLKNSLLRLLEAWIQAIWALALILFKPQILTKIIPEKISGSDFFWDLIALANQNQFSVFFAGGFDDTPELVKKEVLKRFPNLKVAGTSNKSPEQPELLNDINEVQPDTLLVALGPVKQEKWIAENLQNLNIKLAVGLGGTFDYVAGKKNQPPRWVRAVGLEWFFRLITQPYRFKRIWVAVWGLTLDSVKQKFFMSFPYRQNAVGVILNKENRIFLGQRVKKFEEFIETFPLKGDFWQFPQGGIDAGESPEIAAAREIEEETGINNLKYLGISAETFTYNWNHSVRSLFSGYRFRGQSQKIVYFKYLGDESDIKLNQGKNTEFLDYKWIDKSQLKNMHPYKLPVALIVEKEMNKYV